MTQIVQLEYNVHDFAFFVLVIRFRNPSRNTTLVQPSRRCQTGDYEWISHHPQPLIGVIRSHHLRLGALGVQE
jgi:hypothetical protein